MVKIKAKAEIGKSDIDFEFGATQAEMTISKTGKASRALKLKEGDIVEITIRKIK